MNSLPQNITVATTGASGAVFLVSLLRRLEADDRVTNVNFVASDSALRVMADELGITGRSKLVAQLLGSNSTKVKQQSNDDVGANIASGSYLCDAMVVIPCSMGTLGRVANGFASNLIERASDVCLKEKRPLLLCARETPFNKIHIRNMFRACDAGATIFPLVPFFYNQPKTIEDLANSFADRIMAQLGLPQAGAFHWRTSE